MLGDGYMRVCYSSLSIFMHAQRFTEWKVYIYMIVQHILNGPGFTDHPHAKLTA